MIAINVVYNLFPDCKMQQWKKLHTITFAHLAAGKGRGALPEYLRVNQSWVCFFLYRTTLVVFALAYILICLAA